MMIEVMTFAKDGGKLLDTAECSLDAVPLTARTLWDDATAAGTRVGQVGVYVDGKLAQMFTHPPTEENLGVVARKAAE